MSKGIFNPKQHYKCTVIGHCFDKSLQEVELPGYFEADTIEFYDPLTRNNEFAVFKVDEPKNGEYPFHWSGTYKIPILSIVQAPPIEID